MSHYIIYNVAAVFGCPGPKWPQLYKQDQTNQAAGSSGGGDQITCVRWYEVNYWNVHHSLTTTNLVGGLGAGYCHTIGFLLENYKEDSSH